MHIIGPLATHYEVLGVAPGAGHDEIQRAYRRLARDHHPDTKAGEGSAAEDHARQVMAEVNAAWTVLSNPTRRADYDRALGRPRPGTSNPGDGGFTPFHESHEDLDPDDGGEGEGDGAAPQGRPADLIFLVPAALLASSVALFAFSVMTQSSTLMALALVVAPLAIGAFLVMPFVAMLRRARSGAG